MPALVTTRQYCLLVTCVFIAIATYRASIIYSRTHIPLHPLERSINAAEEHFQSLAAQETHTYAQAVESYRARRGRCPPPGFRAFHRHLQELGGISIESFWDQIYDDLEPFWGVPAQNTRSAAASLVSLASFQDKVERLQGFSFRHGEVQANCPEEDMTCDEQLDLLRRIAPLLPDIDVVVSVHASPRVLVPWSVMEQARQQARQQSRLLSRSAGAQTHIHGGINGTLPAAEEDVVKGWNRGKPQYRHTQSFPAENLDYAQIFRRTLSIALYVLQQTHHPITYHFRIPLSRMCALDQSWQASTVRCWRHSCYRHRRPFSPFSPQRTYDM
jgi:hypothetical protein